MASCQKCCYGWEILDCFSASMEACFALVIVFVLIFAILGIAYENPSPERNVVSTDRTNDVVSSRHTSSDVTTNKTDVEAETDDQAAHPARLKGAAGLNEE
ncbi:hypothetical protein D8674_002397 [Pyrus ussuriensis x Pyrus communis]|uniref:Uncharacterized protein n=1 Tax=Pyrus ussuriensis x Pyrus communis TaxID=2448454 RepID=A0A5N5FJL5_9ROSA|nr:hypothetical protein D8674_002397 [Pyrus ussuriensis x Pyrus communis]